MSSKEKTEPITEQIPNEAQSEQVRVSYNGPVVYVSSSQLIPFSENFKGVKGEYNDFKVSNPFDVPDEDDPDMRELRKGIEEYGIMVPLIVRKKKDGKYELLSGYRRKKAIDSINEERRKNSEEELKIPVIEVSDCDNKKAVVILTTSNTHRKKITLREQIKAVGFAYRAMRHQGQETPGEKSTAELVGEMFNIKAKTVQRYSALLNLNDGLLRIIGGESNSKTHRRNNDGQLKLSRRAGEILSTLEPDKQEIILQFLQDDNNSITIPLASWIKKKFKQNSNLKLEDLKKVVEDRERSNESGITSNASEIRGEKISFDDLQTYFPNQTSQEIIATVHSFFNKWREAGSPENFEIKALDN